MFFKKIIFLFFLFGIHPLFAQDQDSIEVQQLIDAFDEMDCETATQKYNEILDRKADFFQGQKEMASDIHFLLAFSIYQCGDSEATYRQALHHQEVALALRKSISSDSKDVIQSYYALSVLHESFGYFKQAIEAGLKAAAILEQKTDPNLLRQSQVYLVLGRSYEERGDLEIALYYIQQTLALSIEKEDDTMHTEALNILGLIYRAYKDYPKALQAFRELKSKSNLPPNYLADCQTNLGLVYNDMDSLDLALQNFEGSKSINRQLYQSEQSSLYRINIAENLENEGIVYTKKKQYDKAVERIEASMKILKEELQTKYHPDIGGCMDNMGDVYFNQADYQTAISFYQKGVQSLIPDFDSISTSSNPDFQKAVPLDQYSLLELLNSKAQSFYKIYQEEPQNQNALSHAFAGYENLDTLVTQIRQGFQAANSKYALIEKTIPIYEQAIEVALELYRIRKEPFFLRRAYQFSDKNKAIVLLEGLHDENAKYNNIPSESIQQELNLRKKNMQLEAQLYDIQSSGTSEQIDSLKKALFNNRRAYASFLQELESQYPRYHDSKYGFIQPANPPQLQNQIPDDALLVEYFIGINSIYIFTLSTQDLNYFSIPKPSNFDQLCLDFRKFSSQDQSSDQQKHSRIAYQLYQILLQEVLEKTNQGQKYTRLFIVPDDQLNQISFDNLFYEKTDSWKNQNNPYLIKKYAISYAYTSKLFFDQAKRERLDKAIKKFAGFGLSYDDYTLKGVSNWNQENGPPNQLKRQIGKLLYAPQEVQEVAKIFDGDFWIDQKATQASFLENAGQYQVLHLAMHAMENKNHPMQSALAFSRLDDSSSFLLRAADIYALPLNAELAVLSACDTGFGKLHKGEGIRSLARAFSYAGCTSIIANLWSASDASSKKILIPFYENLKTGQTKDVALQNAKLQYLQSSPAIYCAPEYWANLVVLGSVAPIDFNTEISFSLWLGLGIALGLIGFFWGYQKIR